jgi:uncharacterized protein YycO
MYKKGNILFTRNYDWNSNRIRKIIKCDYNHIGLFISENEIVEATFKGVVKSPLTKFTDKQAKKQLDFVVCQISDITEEQVNKACEFALNQVGKRYDFIQMLCIGLMTIFHINKKIEPIEFGKKWLCSELIGESFDNANFLFVENVDPDNVSPADILNSPFVSRIGA